MTSILIILDSIIYLPVRICRVLYVAWSDLLLSFIYESQWEFFNRKCYSRTNYYNEHVQSSGLFLWEQLCVEKYFPKTPAKILIMAAGSGREAKVMKNLGYTILACEIVKKFIRVLSTLFEGSKQTEHQILNISFLDIINSKKKDNHLKSSAVIIGHGAFSHLAKRSDQVMLLKRLSEIAPGGVILFSWLKYRNLPKWQRVWRVFIYKLTSRRVTKFKAYGFSCGPINYANTDYIKSVIKDADLSVLHFDDVSSYPHAVCKSSNAS